MDYNVTLFFHQSKELKNFIFASCSRRFNAMGLAVTYSGYRGVTQCMLLSLSFSSCLSRLVIQHSEQCSIHRFLVHVTHAAKIILNY